MGDNKSLVKENNGLQAKYEVLKKEIQGSKDAAKQHFLLMGLDLKEIKDKKMYEGEYKTFDDFLGGEDLSKSSSYQLIQIVETFGISLENLKKFPLSWGRAQKILPAVRQKPQRREEIIEMAKETPYSKLGDELKLYKKNKPAVETSRLVIAGLKKEINYIDQGLKELSERLEKSRVDVLVDLVGTALKDKKMQPKEDVKELNKRAVGFGSMFSDAHKEYRKEKYLHKGGKDMILSKKLVDTYSDTTLARAISNFFKTPKNKRWWGNKFSIGVFYAQVGEITGEEPKGKYTDFVKKQREQQEKEE